MYEWTMICNASLDHPELQNTEGGEPKKNWNLIFHFEFFSATSYHFLPRNHLERAPYLLMSQYAYSFLVKKQCSHTVANIVKKAHLREFEADPHTSTPQVLRTATDSRCPVERIVLHLWSSSFHSALWICPLYREWNVPLQTCGINAVPAGSTAAKQLKLTLRIHIARYALVIATLLARHAFLWNSRKWRSFSPGGSQRTHFRLLGVIVQWTAHVIIHSTDIHVTTSPHM